MQWSAPHTFFVEHLLLAYPYGLKSVVESAPKSSKNGAAAPCLPRPPQPKIRHANTYRLENGYLLQANLLHALMAQLMLREPAGGLVNLCSCCSSPT